jgi:MinD-like ATPase involved in chromosome partitioning or flagellar assembly
MGPDQAVAGSFDVLLIDDVCSFLTPHLVSNLKSSGVEVVGVYIPEDGADAKRRLLECGISDVIETEAGPEEFLEKVRQTLAHRTAPPSSPSPTVKPLSIAVTGPSEGVGMTEVAIALSRALALQIPTALVDLDPVWPSVAQRLDLPLHPNIRTALDHALHNSDRLDSAIHVIGDLGVIGGRADGGQSIRVSRHESVVLFQSMIGFCDVLVADLGPLDAIEDGLVREFETVILVGTGSPVGITRLIRTTERVLSMSPGQSALAVVNMTSPSGFERTEALGMLAESFPSLPVVTLPYDKRLARAAWDGTLVGGGRYGRAVRSMSEVVVRSLW